MPISPNSRPPTPTVLRAIIRLSMATNEPRCWRMYTFLGINGIDFIVSEADAAAMILSLAAGEVSEESLARWIRDNWPKA